MRTSWLRDKLPDYLKLAVGVGARIFAFDYDDGIFKERIEAALQGREFRFSEDLLNCVSSTRCQRAVNRPILFIGHSLPSSESRSKLQGTIKLLDTNLLKALRRDYERPLRSWKYRKRH